jgi:hypothetical protein
MNSDTVSYVVGGAILFGFVVWIYFVYRRHRDRTELLMMELLNQYFKGDISLDLLVDRARDIASHYFLQSAEFHSLAIAAFQRAVDGKTLNQSLSKDDERILFRLLATLKNKFGLTDLYKVEVWRPGSV